MATSGVTPAAADPPRPRPVATGIAAWVGTTIEWYDFYIYATAAALIFNKVFFPEVSAEKGVIGALLTYGVGFLSRPLGAVIFGHFGDRAGRKITLVITLVGMGVCTTLIGLLPSYASVGAAAPTLLVMLRLLQGIAVGGEWGGAVLLGLEQTRHRRTFFAGFAQAGSPSGLLLATIVFAIVGLMPDAAFQAVGWRIPFLLSAALVVVGLLVRLRLSETPEFVENRAAVTGPVKAPLLLTIREGWRGLLLGIGLNLAPFGAFYLVNTFLLFYLTSKVGVPRSQALVGQFVVSLVQAASLLPIALLADRYGAKRMAGIGCFILVLAGYPLFQIASSGQIIPLVFIIAVATIGMTAIHAVCASIIPLQFDVGFRYTANSLAYHLNSVIAGAIVPIVATASVGWLGGSFMGAVILLIGMALIGAACLVIMKNNVNSPSSPMVGATKNP